MSERDGLAIDLGRWEAALGGGAFEEVFAALEEVVGRLEAGQLPLAESLACYELGVKLAARCRQFLDEAELRVSQLEAEAGEEMGQGLDEVPV